MHAKLFNWVKSPFQKIMQIVPKYVNYKRNVTILVVGTGIFCLLFLNIFRPFNWDLDPGPNSRLPMVIDSSVTYFIFADVIALVGLGVIAISRILMYKWVTRGNELTYLIYALWITGEVIVMAVIFSVAVYYLAPPDKIYYDFGMLFVRVLLYTGFTLLLPYLIFHFYFAWDNKTKMVQQLEQEKQDSLMSEPLPILSSVPEKQNMLIRFNDERGKLRLSVMLDNLYYIESADNYVNIHYRHLDKLQTFMLRATMKSIEENYPNVLVRCHRSYIVNVDKIKLIRKEHEGLFIGLDLEKMPVIPLSQTYSSNILAAMEGNEKK